MQPFALKTSCGALECRATGVIEKLGPLLTLRFADDDEDDYKDEED